MLLQCLALVARREGQRDRLEALGLIHAP